MKDKEKRFLEISREISKLKELRDGDAFIKVFSKIDIEEKIESLQKEKESLF